MTALVDSFGEELEFFRRYGSIEGCSFIFHACQRFNMFFADEVFPIIFIDSITPKRVLGVYSKITMMIDGALFGCLAIVEQMSIDGSG